jgi:arylsulfatase A-like enzyme
MISRLDRDVGSILKKLRQHGLEENTLILFTSDNGPHREGGADPDFNRSGGPLRGIKRDLYEGGIRVPMIAYWPGRIVPGTTSDTPSAFWDILPTLAELAGTAVPQDIDGISLVPTLLGYPEKQHKHDMLYWEFHWWHATKQAVRLGRWKAVRLSPGGPLELYDLEKDLAEAHDVAADYPDVIASISEQLQSVRRESSDWELKWE